MESTLKTQIRAMQARIDAVAPDASPEDIVMLAKAVEAVSGRATVFDVLDAGGEATASALVDIEVARKAALDEVHAAGGVTDTVLNSIAALAGRMDAERFVLTKAHNPLPDATKGVYVLTTETNASAFVSLPSYTGDSSLRSYTLLNDSSFVLSVQDAAGVHVGVIQPHGFCFAFITGDTESGWLWKVTRSDEGGINVVFDQPLLVLDGLPAQYMQMLPMPDGFVVCWTYGSTFKITYLQWKDGALVQSPIFSNSYTGISNFSVDKSADYTLVLGWAYSSSNMSAAVVNFASGATVSVDFGPEISVYKSSSSPVSDCVVSMYAKGYGYIAGKYTNSSNYSQYIYPITVSGASLTVGPQLTLGSASAQSQLSVQSMDSRADGMGVLMDSPSASNYTSVYLTSFRRSGMSAPVQVYRIAYGFADMGSYTYSQMVQFLTNDLILCCWWNGAKLYWRLVTIDSSGTLTLGSFGMVDIPNVYFAQNRDTYLRLLVLSETKIALVVSGNATVFPRLMMGEVNAAGTDVSWGSLVDLPFSIKNNTPVISACHDAVRNALLVGETITNTSPFALVAKL